MARKATHASVEYGPSHDGADRCDKCEHFVRAKEGEHAGCKIVQSPIYPNGWCNKFEAK